MEVNEEGMIIAWARFEMEAIVIEMPPGVFLKKGEPKPESEIQVKWTPVYQITSLPTEKK